MNPTETLNILRVQRLQHYFIIWNTLRSSCIMSHYHEGVLFGHLVDSITILHNIARIKSVLGVISRSIDILVFNFSRQSVFVETFVGT